MKRLYVRLNTLAPLSTRADQAAIGVDIASYIAGNTLRGSLAAAHRLFHPDRKDEFEQFFLQEYILYPNLYPAVVESGVDDEQDMSSPVYPVPKTAQSCKRGSGFLYPKTETNDGHGVRDTLLDWALFKLGMSGETQRFEPLDALLEYKRCALCNEPMDRFNGYYRRGNVSGGMIATNVHSTRLQTHAGINRESGTAQEGSSYDRQVFDEGMVFWGEIKLVDDRLLNAFKKFITDVGAAGLIRMGTGRTRGMGKVKIEVVESREEVQERKANFAIRLQSFNSLLVKNIARRRLENFYRDYFFAITLHSPLILSDEFLRYRGTIDASILKELLEIPVEGLEQVYQCASIKLIMGWQELWGMPRANEYAIDTGSVFLFRYTSPDQRVVDALFGLEEQGIGKRRAEGFGRICISDSFHKEATPK